MGTENIFKNIWGRKTTFCDITANYCPWQASLSTGLLVCHLVFHLLRGNSDLRNFPMKAKLTPQDHRNDKLLIFCRNQKKIFSNVFCWHVIYFLFSNMILCGSHQNLQRTERQLLTVLSPFSCVLHSNPETSHPAAQALSATGGGASHLQDAPGDPSRNAWLLSPYHT